MKKLYFLIIAALVINLTNAQWIQIGQDIDGEATADESGWCVSLNADGSIVAIGAPLNSGNGTESGHVRVYEKIGGTWIQFGNDIDGENGYEESGSTVALNSNGNIVAIGSPRSYVGGTNIGHVRVFEYSGGNWVQLGNMIIGETSYDNSGCAVSLNGDGTIVAIGAQNNDGSFNNAGHVRIFQYITGVWTQIGNDLDGEAGSGGGGETAGDRFGYSVRLNYAGNILAVGADCNDGNGNRAGHVRVFDFTGGNWVQLGNDIDGEAAQDYSGKSVSLNSSGTRVAIGAPNNFGNGSNSGHARVYEYNGSAWVQLGNDIDGEDANDHAGWSVSLNAVGDILAIGASANEGTGSNEGHVRVFKYTNGNWNLVTNEIIGESYYDGSGWSVNIDSTGNTVAIGAFANDGTSTNLNDDRGHVRVYKNYSTYDTLDIIECGSYISPSNNYIWDTTGTYTDIIPNSSGYDSVLTINLTIHLLPVVNIGPDTTLCADDQIILYADSSLYNTYLWSMNSLLQNIMIDSTGIGLASEEFWVQVTDSNGCMQYDTINITFEICSDINRIFSNKIFGYPNPTSDRITIQTEGVESIKVYDVAGKKIQDFQNVEDLHIIDLSSKPKGIYIIKVITKKQTITRKLIKQ